MTKGLLKHAASALISKDADSIWIAADELLTLVTIGKAEYVQPLFVVVDALADLDINAAIGIVKAAVYVAPSGSPFRQRAMAGWAKYAKALAVIDVSAATKEIGYIATICASDSTLGQQAAILGHLLPTRPKPPRTAETPNNKAVKAFMRRFG
jgi:hypothetical protein